MPNILDSWYGLRTVGSTALENSHILATPTTLGFGGPFDMPSFTAFNFDTATGYMILFFDTLTLPANGAVTPVYWAFVAAATATIPQFVAISWTEIALKFSTGIVVAGSSVLTTPFTLTVGTNSKLAFTAQVSA